ncbi:MAG TPA: hypothetical protein VN493_20020 [Thermoanaerobaculia bacterium]|nr:hypothetical protein [Thermoanaerobaculia bacterium]
MTKPVFPVQWKIAASSSPIFPVHSRLEIKPVKQSSRFDFVLKLDGQPPRKLFDRELPEVTIPGATPSVRGDFDDEERPFLLVMTLCPGKDEKALRLLCGQVHEHPSGGADPGGTGVWVAEEQPPKDPPDWE